ncbi:HAD family hydrolase [Kribbella sandramycini]|uniref:FMN phosphatase YigB (HAD superfamily) n=1 Tax=Kribbella sandramycini TaxID=60450 RepID=A0A7Y4KYU7_9ACTN|nr:HAD family hydrolase [Kribbella sandramycini]MBB6569829.1 FMN phosphatase YigB (HAD superfamily) [Kribbella sandramycini]NOL40346.1 HAD family hydrolase [Kribbella sandramycini]
MRRIARVVVALVAAALLFGPAGRAEAAGQRPHCSVVWFDLGNTLVDTSVPGQTTYMEGALRHLWQLRAVGVPIGVITNVPPEWGATDAERAAATKAFVDSTWAEEQPFPWEWFGDRFLTPRTKAESKPALALFERGRDAAAPCRSFYEGETLAEITAAEQAGLTGYLIGQPDRPKYLPIWKVLLR